MAPWGCAQEALQPDSRIQTGLDLGASVRYETGSFAPQLDKKKLESTLLRKPRNDPGAQTGIHDGPAEMATTTRHCEMKAGLEGVLVPAAR